MKVKKTINGRDLGEHIDFITEELEQYVDFSQTMIQVKLSEIIHRIIDERIETFERLRDYKLTDVEKEFLKTMLVEEMRIPDDFEKQLYLEESDYE